MSAVNDLNDVFVALADSAFRRRFRLQASERAYLQSKGIATVIEHARDLIDKRLAGAMPINDGRQTPFRGHPVFVAQHATAACCRSCLEKWHGIPRGRALTIHERHHVVAVLERWLQMQAGG
jgi:hypothetical protein